MWLNGHIKLKRFLHKRKNIANSGICDFLQYLFLKNLAFHFLLFFFGSGSSLAVIEISSQSQW